MDKITEMLIKERDQIKNAIENGSYLDTHDELVEKPTPADAPLRLAIIEFLVEEAIKLNAQTT